ncbi:response regulator [Microvirga sp. M2]|uniref:response regulator n=1 Tax=Microvirga sp. M2 TaxID=3073270 RepID=UPI0039C4B342
MTLTRCMIVEDQALIGMSLEAFLEDAGFRVEGPFMSNAQAMSWLETETPDIALLDVMLKDGTSVEIARALKSRGIPFVIYSGLPAASYGPSELQGVIWLEKPVSRETLAAALDEVLSQRQLPVMPDGLGR